MQIYKEKGVQKRSNLLILWYICKIAEFTNVSGGIYNCK